MASRHSSSGTPTSDFPDLVAELRKAEAALQVKNPARLSSSRRVFAVSNPVGFQLSTSDV